VYTYDSDVDGDIVVGTGHTLQGSAWVKEIDFTTNTQYTYGGTPCVTFKPSDWAVSFYITGSSW